MFCYWFRQNINDGLVLTINFMMGFSGSKFSLSHFRIQLGINFLYYSLYIYISLLVLIPKNAYTNVSI